MWSFQIGIGANPITFIIAHRPAGCAAMSTTFLAAASARALDTQSAPPSQHVAASPISPEEVEAVDLSTGSLTDLLNHAFVKAAKEKQTAVPPDWGSTLHALGTQKPEGVAAPQFIRSLPNGDYCCTCARSSKVLIVSPTAKLVREVGPPTGERPISFATGIASDEGATALFVADHFNHRVLKLDLHSGALLAKAGSEDGADGSGAGEFECPEDLLLSPDGKLLFVADRNNSRVAVLDSTTLAWKGQIGREGKRAGELYIPVGLALDADRDELVVAESAGRRLSAFRPKPGGAFVRHVGAELDAPNGLLLVGDLLFATEERRILMLAWPNGTPLASVGTGMGLKGLCAAPGRRLLVADEAAGLLHVFGVDSQSRKPPDEDEVDAAGDELD